MDINLLTKRVERKVYAVQHAYTGFRQSNSKRELVVRKDSEDLISPIPVTLLYLGDYIGVITGRHETEVHDNDRVEVRLRRFGARYSVIPTLDGVPFQPVAGYKILERAKKE